MFTLDTPPEEIITHPQFAAPDFCRSTLRVRRWNDSTMRELLSRPPQSSIIESCLNLQSRSWDLCDEDLKRAVIKYLKDNSYG